VKNFDSAIFSFLDNDQFIQWVTHPDESVNAYWNDWMQKNPHRVEELLMAKQIATDLKLAQKEADSDKLSIAIWDKINMRIDKGDKVISISRHSYKRSRFIIAASVAAALVVISSTFYLLSINKKEGNKPVQKIASSIVSNDLRHINVTSESRIVYLVDGTKITLKPGASIRHAVFLQKDKREVYLDGDAFFEVAKDSSRPFYVYAHDIVLRVLGTSFNVTTNKSNGNVTVFVRTGKVSVYKKSNRSKAEFILTPNESVLYTAQNQSIVKSEFDTSLSRALITSNYAINFNFEEIPVTKIFEVLEEAYGIKIIYDKEIFSKCIITTALNDATFDEKLKIICEATNATYNIENNEVTVSGQGCK
jgi:transmembrane sensor